MADFVETFAASAAGADLRAAAVDNAWNGTGSQYVTAVDQVQVRLNANGSVTDWVTGVATDGDDVYAEIDVTAFTFVSTGTPECGVVVRMPDGADGTAAADGYLLDLNHDGDMAVYKLTNNGGFTQVGSTVTGLDVSTPLTLRCEVEGNEIRGYLNGNLELTATDGVATYPTNVTCGIFGFRGATSVNDVVIDEFRFGDLTTAVESSATLSGSGSALAAGTPTITTTTAANLSGAGESAAGAPTIETAAAAALSGRGSAAGGTPTVVTTAAAALSGRGHMTGGTATAATIASAALSGRGVLTAGTALAATTGTATLSARGSVAAGSPTVATAVQAVLSGRGNLIGGTPTITGTGGIPAAPGGPHLYYRERTHLDYEERTHITYVERTALEYAESLS